MSIHYHKSPNTSISISDYSILPSIPQIHRFLTHSTLITHTLHPIHTIITLLSSPHHHNQLITLISSLLLSRVSIPQPPRFIPQPSPASSHIIESVILLENSHSQQYPFSSTPLSTRSSQTCICLQRRSHLLFSLVNTLFYHTCSWTQSDCMLSLFLFPLYEESLRLCIPIKSYCNHSVTQSTVSPPYHSEIENLGK